MSLIMATMMMTACSGPNQAGPGTPRAHYSRIKFLGAGHCRITSCLESCRDREGKETRRSDGWTMTIFIHHKWKKEQKQTKIIFRKTT